MVNVIGMTTTRQTGVSAEAIVIVKVMSTATFQTETVATVPGENASPSLLGKTVMAFQTTKFAVVTTKSTRITAKPISKAGRVFKIRAAAPILLLSNGLIYCPIAANEEVASYCPSKFQLDGDALC